MSFSFKCNRNLTGYYLNPGEGEEVPISFLSLEEVSAGWSHELNKNIYSNDPGELEGLKRVREVFLLRVFNALRGGESIIELNNSERMQFEDVHHDLVLYGGKMYYFKKKAGRRKINCFRLERPDLSSVRVNRATLDEKL